MKSEVDIKNGYDAVLNGNPTRSPIFLGNLNRTEDHLLQGGKRSWLSEGVRDGIRNFALLQFACNFHLDNVANISFTAKTSDNNLNKRLFEEWELFNERMDASGKFCFKDFITIAERCRLFDGDVFIKRESPYQYRIIESKQVANPRDIGINVNQFEYNVTKDQFVDKRYKSDKWVDGLNFVNGCLSAVCIYETPTSKPEIVPIKQIEFIPYQSYYTSQARGITPLASARNAFEDLYESISLAIQRAKISQLGGWVIKRPGYEPTKESIQKMFSDAANGVANFDLDSTMDVSWLSSQGIPANEFQQFCDKVGALALSSLDINYQFYVGNVTDASIQQYINSVQRKQRPLIRALNHIFDTYLEQLILEGKFGRYNVTRQEILSRTEIVGVTLPLLLLFKNAGALAALHQLGLVTDRNLSARLGFSDDGDSIEPQVVSEIILSAGSSSASVSPIT